MVALVSLGEHSQSNNLVKRIISLYLYASGAQRQTINVLSKLGICESYSSMINPKLRRLRRTKGRKATTHLSPSINDTPTLAQPSSGAQPTSAVNSTTPPSPSGNGNGSPPSQPSEPVRQIPAANATTALAALGVPSGGALEGQRLGTIYQLSDANRAEARRIAATGLYGVVYDNININFATAEQILGRHGEFLFDIGSGLYPFVLRSYVRV